MPPSTGRKRSPAAPANRWTWRSSSLRLLHGNLCAGGDGPERRGVALHLAEDGHLAGRPDLIAPAHGGGAKEDAEGAAWPPVAQVAQLHHLLALLLSLIHISEPTRRTPISYAV